MYLFLKFPSKYNTRFRKRKLMVNKSATTLRMAIPRLAANLGHFVLLYNVEDSRRVRQAANNLQQGKMDIFEKRVAFSVPF